MSCNRTSATNCTVVIVCVAMLLAVALFGCQLAPQPISGPVERETVSHLFLPLEVTGTQPSTLPIADMFNTAVPLPTAVATRAPTPTAGRPAVKELLIYGDELASGWSLAQSWDMEIDPANEEPVRSGSHSLRATPLKANGAVFLSNADPQRAYLRADYGGVRFMLNGGEQGLTLEDLAVTVLGSNVRPDFDANDDSVPVDEDAGPFFSETRLYFLGFNRAIPPDTWVTVEVWLDDLPYDPDYVYITGLYVKNDAYYTGTFYLDDVALVPYGG